jgi:hypothetical protein
MCCAGKGCRADHCQRGFLAQDGGQLIAGEGCVAENNKFSGFQVWLDDHLFCMLPLSLSCAAHAKLQA